MDGLEEVPQGEDEDRKGGESGGKADGWRVMWRQVERW